MKKYPEKIVINPVKGIWVCVREQTAKPELNTIQYYRSDSIEKLLEGSDLTWKQAKSYGWKCIRVDINFNPQIPD